MLTIIGKFMVRQGQTRKGKLRFQFWPENGNPIDAYPSRDAILPDIPPGEHVLKLTADLVVSDGRAFLILHDLEVVQPK